jgi:hypothetical protein
MVAPELMWRACEDKSTRTCWESNTDHSAGSKFAHFSQTIACLTLNLTDNCHFFFPPILRRACGGRLNEAKEVGLYNRQLPEKIKTLRYGCRSEWPRGLRRRSASARPLRSWVRIPPGAWMFVSCEYCVLSGRGL